jgi:hypothetical protein
MAWRVLQVALVVLVVAPVALVLAVALSLRSERRRLVAVTRVSCCPACSAFLNERALETADALWARHMTALHEQHPGTRFRIVRTLVAVCSDCGARLGFAPKTRTFHVVRVLLAFESAAPN